MVMDLSTGIPTIVVPKNITDLDKLKGMIAFWVENKEKAHRNKDGVNVRVWQMVQA